MTLIHTNINSSICIPTPQKQYFHFSREAAQEWWAVRELTVFKDGRHCLHEPQGGRDLARQMIMPSLQTALHLFCFSRVYCAYLQTVHIGRKGLVKYVSLLQQSSSLPLPAKFNLFSGSPPFFSVIQRNVSDFKKPPSLHPSLVPHVLTVHSLNSWL